MWKLDSQEDRFKKHITFKKPKHWRSTTQQRNKYTEIVGQGRQTVPRWHHQNHYNKFRILFFFFKLKRAGRKKKSVHTWTEWVSEWMKLLCLGGQLRTQASKLTTTGSGRCQPSSWTPFFMFGPRIFHPMQLRATNLNMHCGTRTVFCFQFVMSLLSRSCAGPIVSINVAIHR